MSEGLQTNRTRRITELLDGKFMARLDALDVFSRKVLQGKLQGERRSRRRGQSVEFADHRPYVEGDDLRFVDWNIYGRLDQLFLKIFLEEVDLSVHVLLDASASMSLGEPSKYLATRKLAAALSYVGLANNCRVTVSRFADGLAGQLANMRSRNYVHRMADFLLSGETEGESDFEKSCRQLVAGRIGTGIVIVISDFLFKQGYEQGLRRLISSRYELYAMQVLSPQETDPQISGDLKLIDVEDRDAAEVTVNASVMKYYKNALASYCNELKDFCTRRGATYVLANSSAQVEMLMLNYLRKIGLLK